MAFQVFGSEVRVHDERLGEAIMKLSEKQRNILLMFYFLEMSDAEISEVLGIARCTVYRNRMRSLDFIRDRYRRIEKILNHYNAYISKACLRPFYDEYGNMQLVVDMELRGRIRNAITKAILKFEVEIK